MCTCIVCLCVSVLGGRDSLAILLPLRWKQEKDILCRTIITSLPRETDLLPRVSCVLHMCNTVLG